MSTNGKHACNSRMRQSQTGITSTADSAQSSCHAVKAACGAAPVLLQHMMHSKRLTAKHNTTSKCSCYVLLLLPPCRTATHCRTKPQLGR
jgi:hypothetical protein